MKFARIRVVEKIGFLRTLIVVYILCAIWFKVAPDTLSDSLREVERSLDTPLYERLDNIIVVLLYVRTALCVFLWLPTKLVAWTFASVEAAIFFLGAFGGPSFMSPADSIVGGIQGMVIPAILTVLYVSGVFGGLEGRPPRAVG